MSGTVTPALVHQRDLTVYNPDMELAFMFAFTEYDKRRHEQYRDASYVFFSKILWPIALMQAGPENYIAIDRMKYFFDLQFKITDFPKSDSALLTSLKQNFLSPQDRLSMVSQWIEELKDAPSSQLSIKGLINPEILHGLIPLIKLATEKPLNNVTLDPIISTDDMIEIAAQYNQALKNIEGVIPKWHSLRAQLQQKRDQWHLADEEESFKAKFLELNKKISDYIWTCRSQFDYLFHWAIPGHILSLVFPYTEIWVSMYLAQIKLPDKLTKRFLVIPPSIFSKEIKAHRWVPVDAFHTSFYTILKERIETTLATQKELTLKIEAQCVARNLFLTEDAHALITRGFNRIEAKELIERKYIEDLRLKWKTISETIHAQNKNGNGA